MHVLLFSTQLGIILPLVAPLALWLWLDPVGADCLLRPRLATVAVVQAHTGGGVASFKVSAREKRGRGGRPALAGSTRQGLDGSLPGRHGLKSLAGDGFSLQGDSRSGNYANQRFLL